MEDVEENPRMLSFGHLLAFNFAIASNLSAQGPAFA